MPDTRRHRGAHPEDAALFARERWPILRLAAAELDWLLDRGYAMRSSLALVGDRHGLTQRQRLGLARSTCSAMDRDRRAGRHVSLDLRRGAELWIDAYNLLISVEAALAGGVILSGRDRCFRDLASLHGTYRTVSETLPAIELIGETLDSWQVGQCRWVIDRPVSNSGRLKELLADTAMTHGWRWETQLEFSPDAVLAQSEAIVATSDSVVLDRCRHWANVAREIITARVRSAFVVDLGDAEPAGAIDPARPAVAPYPGRATSPDGVW